MTQKNSLPFRYMFSLAAMVWTFAAGAVLVMELSDQRAFVAAIALSTARSVFAKDLAFRRWAAKHGGVYVPVTDETPPNPYLKIPEREITTPSGIPLTRMNPAYMTRQIYEISSSLSDSPLGHITSLNPIRPENAPDPWEKKAMEIFEKGVLEFSGFQEINGKPYFRYMHALKTEKPCLKCHAAQGYHEGDVRGGISVSLPMALLNRSLASSNSFHYLIIVAIWLVGIGGIWFGGRKISASSQALRESEERYRQQFQQSQAVMLIVNPDDGSIEEANPAACTFYGYSDEKLRAMNITEINCAADENVMRRLSGVREGLFKRFQYRHRLADGSQRDVEIFSSPFSSQGRMHLHSIIFDITDRLVAERELHEKMNFAENLIRNSTAPTFVIDADHKVLIWNRALEELTGVRASEMIGTDQHWRAFYMSHRPTLADIIIDGKIEEAATLYPHFLRSRLITDGLHAEADYLLNNRGCHLVFASAPIRDKDGKVIAAIETLEDITERILLEAQLLQSQKMESVGVLAGGIAHDFNNVLTVISGYADLLQLTLADDQENLLLVREISASANRAAEMTHGLLAFSGKHDMQMQYDDLNQILASISKSLGRLIREDIAFSIQPGAERLPVFVDRVQIEQVLINLVINARDALEAGGVIVVSAQSVAFEEALLVGNAIIPAGRYARFSVKDNGAGIDSVTVSSIFEPFFTTKERGKGTGLGLAIVRNIITRHKGHISVTSVPGSGTEFRVYLPLYSGKAFYNQTGIAQPFNYHGSETVLLAEDDAAIMRLFQDVLTRYGYTVLAASDGAEALEMFSLHRDRIQAAIVDVIMPQMNGREVVEAIRRQRPELPVIMTSGYTDEIVDRAAIDQLRVLFLQKPLKPLDLLAAIRRGLQNGNPLRAEG